MSALAYKAPFTASRRVQQSLSMPRRSHAYQVSRKTSFRRPAAALEEAPFEPMDSLAPSTSYNAATDDDAESRGLALALAKVAWETKGEDILVLNVSPLVYWTRYLVIVSVFSRPQLNAMIVKMEQEAAALGRTLEPNKQVGRTTWELLDYGDVVVNVMTEQQREYYDLESFYGAAEELELPFTSGAEPAAEWSTKL